MTQQEGQILTCCTECFEHPWVRSYVARASQPVHKCEACGSDDVSLVQSTKLWEYFRRLVGWYETESIDETLVMTIQAEWRLFNTAKLDPDRQVALFQTIVGKLLPLEPDEWAQSGTVASDSEEDIGDDWWDPLDEGHIDLQASFGLETVACEILQTLSIPARGRWRPARLLPARYKLYRARVGCEVMKGRPLPFTAESMGAPPHRPAGRANEAGQLALYCAETEMAAVIEVRPAVGLAISVAEMSLSRDLKVIDLVNGLRPANPFLARSTGEPTTPAAEAFKKWSVAMATPIARGDSLEYSGTQILASSAREQGWDGIRYKSALSPRGHNVVLFDQNAVEISESKLVRVREVFAEYDVLHAL